MVTRFRVRSGREEFGLAQKQGSATVPQRNQRWATRRVAWRRELATVVFSVAFSFVNRMFRTFVHR